MKFCTAINCMDGRVQLPVIKYLQNRFDAEYVDAITEAGANRVLAIRDDPHLVESMLEKLKISLEKHHSVGVAIVGHYDCAGNPADRDEQIKHTKETIDFIHRHYPKIEIIGLWVDENWKVNEVA
ncbi:hypothetical protein B6D60_05100 [candidate division KSB1 bacterium 4484_87]|nr:MAG: hypothetical protein B6D60_05100 [candidate division KSB1 bacterium 4484_87]